MKAREFIKKKLPLLVAVAIYIAVCYSFIGCPIKFFIGIPCPGCGMTRAVVSALRLDFASAFRFHPLFPIAPLFIAYIFAEDMLPSKASRVLAAVFAILFFSVYFFRIFFAKDPVTAIDPEGGFVVKSIRYIISFFGGHGS